MSAAPAQRPANGDVLAWVGAHRTGVSAGIVAVACVSLAVWDRPSMGAVVTFTLATTALMTLVLLTGRGQPTSPSPG